MHKLTLNNQGFALVEALLIVVALAVVGGAGAYVYHKDHKAKTPVSSTTSTTNKATSQTIADPYAGWKSYCDTTHHYCFKYPADWTFDQNVALSPSKSVQVAYANPDTRDGGQLDFTPSYTGKISGANQDLTAVGGYYLTGGDYSPSYGIVDSSLLATRPLTVGQQSKFPGNPSFTDQAAADSGSRGQLVASPTKSITTVADSQAWLSSADAKTSLKILQSLYYQK